MSLVILPLRKCSLTLSRVFFLVEELVKYFHGLFIRNNALAIELVLAVSEPDNVVTLAVGSLALNAYHGIVLLIKLLHKLSGLLTLLLSLTRSLARH